MVQGERTTNRHNRTLSEGRNPLALSIAPRFDRCIVLRRKLIERVAVAMNFGTGDIQREISGYEWRTEACSTPLFTKEEERTGVCRSCASGWTHENNYPVEAIPKF
jgi:hypothetical protein